jgi:hypothetical protein
MELSRASGVLEGATPVSPPLPPLFPDRLVHPLSGLAAGRTGDHVVSQRVMRKSCHSERTRNLLVTHLDFSTPHSSSSGVSSSSAT